MPEVRPIDANSLIGFLHNQEFIDGDDRSRVYGWIEAQPTIKPEQQHAYWEPNDFGEYHCTYCGAECDIDEFHKALLNKFCGNCGSYMIGGE